MNSLRAVTIQLGYCGALLNARVVELHIQVMALLLCTCLVLPGRAETGATAAENTAPSGIVPASRSALVAKYGKLPLSFEKNEGQADSRVKYLTRGQGYGLFLTPTEAVLSLQSTTCNASRTSLRPNQNGPSCSMRDNVLRLEMLGANPDLQITGDELLPGKSNYFIGNDPAHWRTGVPHFARVRYNNVYPGIDLVYYGNQGQLEFDLVAAPGADLSKVRFKLNGARKLEVSPDGNLVVHVQGGEIRMLKPAIFQTTADGKMAVDGHYVLKANREVGFETGVYDRNAPLVVDPTLVYSTFIGGTGNDYGVAIAVDASGNAYIGGVTTSTDFPTASPLQTTGEDFVAKLNPSGTALIYSTYFGQTTGSNLLEDLAIDGSGNVYVAGEGAGSTFPVVNQIPSACDSNCQLGASAGFVTKLNAAGSALVYSSRIGGCEALAIAVDSSGNAYVAGETTSSDFPTVNAFQAASGGGSDAFLLKVNAAGSALDYSSYLGGSGSDQATGVAVDSSGNAYVAGTTNSPNFPTQGQISGSCVGACGNGTTYDVFVSKFSSTGSTLVYSSLIGGSGYDVAAAGNPLYNPNYGHSIAVDASGNAYVGGITDGNPNDFPTTTGAFQTSANCAAACQDGFVTKINAAGNALSYSTFFGTTPSEVNGLAVDSSGDLAITGLFVVPFVNAFYQNGNSAGIAVLNPAGSALLISSTSGHGLGLTFDAAGNVYDVGIACGNGLLTTTGALQTTCKSTSGSNAFAVEISLAGIAPAVTFSPSNLTFSSQTVGTTSAGQAINLSNTGGSALDITGITITGTDSADFSQTNTCGTSIAANSSCLITVTFNPTATGSRAASVSIADNASGSPQTVSLTGTGTAASPVVSFAPTSITFSSQTVGTTSSGQNITLTNTGTAALNVTGISITGTNSGDFSQTNTCGSSVAAGAFCTISITFTPSASGTRTASISIADNASGSPQTVSLTGTGATAAPAVTLSPTSLTFSSQNVGSSSAAQMITLTDSGTASLNITGITITGTNAGDYSETTTCGSSVAVNANCTISVIFKPTAAGARTASVSIADNATGSPQSVALTGTAVTTAPSVTLAPTSLTFASQTVGTSSTAQNIMLTNGGNATLNLSSITIAGANSGDFAQTNTCGSSVAAGANCTISVTFKPTSSGTRTGSVSIANNAGNSPQSVALTGTAVAAAPSVTLSPTSLTFASQNIGSASSAQSVTLTNSGTASLTITGISITGTNAGDYSETNTCGSSVAASANCAISVIFNPTAAGTRTASISIADNATGSPQIVQMSGTGAAPPPDFSMTANPTTITVTAGKSGTSTLTITPVNGFNQQVSFACTGLPSKSACSFSPSNITPNGAAATTTVTLSTDGSSSATAKNFAPSTPASIALAGLFASLFSLFIVRKRALRLFPVLLVIFVLGVLAGCGGSSHDTAKGSYTITVTASSGSGASALSHTTNVTLTVQ